MSRAWAAGSTRAWRTTRAAVLRRDGYACQLRLDVCTHLATCVHHTLGKAHPIGDDPMYLIAACQACNNKIGDPARHRQHDPPNEAITRW